MEPTIQPVTAKNWGDLIKLKVSEDQKNFVTSNLYSIAEAQFGDDYKGNWDLYPFGIYDGETPVGFHMYGFNFEHLEYQAFIIRLMVDEKHQGRGYGRYDMQRMLEVFRTDERITTVGISYEPQNEAARKFYASLGFVELGKMIEGDVLAVLRLK
jgi:diamine N-acetyltransferase